MYKKYAIIIGLLLSQAICLFGGNLDTTKTTNEKTMYTLEDIYIRLTTGSNRILLNHSLSPSAPPGSTMHTLNQIFSNIPSTNDVRAGIQGGVLVLPNVVDVKNSVNYGANGTEFTGSYSPSVVFTNADFLVQRSGQITSYRAGDDAIYRKGFIGGYTNADGSWDGNTRFTDNLDGTVTDNLTGLMWTTDANQGAGTKQWNPAVDDATNCTAGGYNDWRLPGVRELHSLVDYQNFCPSLPTGHPFINVQNNYYWTSTTSAGSTSGAWLVIFYYGDVTFYDKTTDLYVWYVRAGQ